MMFVGQGLVLPVDLILQVGNVVRSDLEFTLELNDFILGFDAILGVQVTLSTDSFIEVLLLLHLLFVLHVLLLEFGDKVFLQFDLLDHLHQVGVGLVSVLTVGVSLLLDLGNEAHKLSASDGLEVELLLEGRDVSLFSVELVLVLGVGLVDLAQVLLHHITLTDEVMDVSLLLVSLLVNPLDLTGEGRHGVGGDHLLIESLLAASIKTVILLVEILHVTLSLRDDLLHLTDSVSAHLLFLDNLGVSFGEDVVTLNSLVVLVGAFLKVVTVLPLIGHFLLFLFIEVSHLEVEALNLVLEILLLLLMILDDDFLTVDVFL